mmetsp:Transcript_8020/g.19169  ORF Transcript_8020/g.19169 Transcript_8020/m.19169 type:complete len:108 (+) Transcript_8020:212-535(+)
MATYSRPGVYCVTQVKQRSRKFTQGVRNQRSDYRGKQKQPEASPSENYVREKRTDKSLQVERKAGAKTDSGANSQVARSEILKRVQEQVMKTMMKNKKDGPTVESVP